MHRRKKDALAKKTSGVTWLLRIVGVMCDGACFYAGMFQQAISTETHKRGDVSRPLYSPRVLTNAAVPLARWAVSSAAPSRLESARAMWTAHHVTKMHTCPPPPKEHPAKY